MAEYYIHTERMSVGYDGTPLIENIGIGVCRGEILTLIGPNGAGKSTILRSLIRQLRLLAGTVVLDGRPMAALTEQAVARKMAILMTDRVQPERMSCREVVATGRYPYTGRLGLLRVEDWKKVDEALEMVHAAGLANRPFAQVSDGQRQRLLLARAVCQEPEVIVLDEPTSFLDVRHKLELLSILKRLVREKNVAVILSLHELDLAQKISDQIVCVDQNGIERCGTPEQIFRDETIRALYGIERGSYNTTFGCLEMEPVPGPPRVFVIGGGGYGIPAYRLLQRRGIPFAAGVLPKNDMDYPVARALAAELIAEKPFEPVGEEAVSRAMRVMERCAYTVCCTPRFGAENRANQRLYEQAAARGRLIGRDELEQLERLEQRKGG